MKSNWGRRERENKTNCQGNYRVNGKLFHGISLQQSVSIIIDRCRDTWYNRYASQVTQYQQQVAQLTEQQSSMLKKSGSLLKQALSKYNEQLACSVIRIRFVLP